MPSRKDLFVLSMKIKYKIVYTCLYAKSITIHNLTALLNF